MPIANYTTEVPVERTMADVTKALAHRGVTRISTLYDGEGTPAGLAFTMNTSYGPRDFELPVRTDGVYAAIAKEKLGPKYRTREHAARVAWRIAADWLRAQSALIDAQLASLDEVMFPYMVGSYDGGVAVTAYQHYRSMQGEIEA